MKFHIFVLFVVIILFGNLFTVSAQVDSVIGQVSSSFNESFAGGISGDGRFIVFESAGNLATENPRNSDGSREIFLFDYAQRRIFQITDTKSLLKDATIAPTFDNIKVEIVSIRPVISNNGRWIAFSSNATCTYPGNGTIPPIVSTTNPGSFDANAPAASNPCITGTSPNQINNLVNDGNTEIWLYQIPVAPAADLTTGDEIPITDLSTGTFTQVTNSIPSRLPVPGTASTLPIIADDNHDSSIDDTGSAISFTSNRDLITGGNPFPSADNDEIFAFVRASSAIKQITTTPRGTISAPIYNINSTITNTSPSGWRIAFMSNGNNPIVGMTGNTNADNNEEIFYVDLDASGNFGATKKQVTTTTRTNPGDVVNIFNYGRRMSRDGRYIAFDSYADLANENGGTNQTSFATYLYDTTLTTNAFRRILPRSDADAGAFGGDLQRYVGFTDYDVSGTTQTLVMQTRLNIKSDGTIPTTSSDGLNDNAARPTQIYSFPLNVSPASATFTRQTKLPTPSFFLASTQPIPSNSIRRMTFNLSQTETGTGNNDLASEVYYFLLPFADSQTAASLNFATGASRIAISPSPVPTPSPTPSPSPTATPTPTPTPSVTPTPTPSPTPQQPSAVQGVSPGLLAILDYNSGTNQPVVARTATGSIQRRFTLPIELSGVTMTINGAACGLKTVGQRQIVFVVPPGLPAADAGTVYPVVINNNGLVFRGNVTVVPARPDIFTNLISPGPGGRAQIFNSVNRVLTREPFTITTFKLRGSRRVQTILRVYVTGINNLSSAGFSIRIGSRDISGALVLTGATLVEPGVYTVDFTLPAELAGAGDQPIIFSATVNGIVYQSRLDDTAPRLSIL